MGLADIVHNHFDIYPNPYRDIVSPIERIQRQKIDKDTEQRPKEKGKGENVDYQAGSFKDILRKEIEKDQPIMNRLAVLDSKIVLFAPLNDIANGLEKIGMFQEADVIDNLFKFAFENKEIQFNTEYSLKDIFPGLYSALYPQIKAVLGGSEQKIKSRYETLVVKFEDKKSPNFEYDIDTYVIHIILPQYVLEKIESENGTIDFLKLTMEFNRDFALRDGIIHEIIHSLQGIGVNLDTKKDYVNQRKTKKYKDITYEQDAVVKSLLMAKKLDLKFEELDRSSKYHLWNSFKNETGLSPYFNKLESLDKNDKQYKIVQQQILDVLNKNRKRLNKDVFYSYTDAMKYYVSYFENYGHKVIMKQVIDRAIKNWNEKQQSYVYSIDKNYNIIKNAKSM